MFLDSAFEEDAAFCCCRCFRLEVFESPPDLRPFSVGFTILTAMAPEQFFCCERTICCTVTFAAASAVLRMNDLVSLFSALALSSAILTSALALAVALGARASQSSELIFQS